VLKLLCNDEFGKLSNKVSTDEGNPNQITEHKLFHRQFLQILFIQDILYFIEKHKYFNLKEIL
jgi:hypothetical protein